MDMIWTDYFVPALWSLGVIIAGMSLVAAGYRPFRKTSVKIVVFLLLVAYGTGVYVAYYYTEHGIRETNAPDALLAYVNNALSVFFPSRGAYEELEGPYRFRIHFHLFHFLAYVYAALFFLSLFAGRMMNRLRGYFPHGKEYLFFGVDEPSLLLARDVLRHNRRAGCFFLVTKNRQDDKALFDELDGMGAIVRYVDFDRETSGYLRRGCNGYFFLDENQDFNAAMALKVLRDTTAGKKMNLYIRSEDKQIDPVFRNRPDDVEVRIIHTSGLIAQYFVRQYPMLDCPEISVNEETLRVDGRFRLLLLGFGWAGCELLEKCICDAQFKGSDFAATIVDRDMEEKYGDYLVRNKTCIERYNLEFVDETVGSRTFYERMEAGVSGYNRILVTLGDDRSNIDTALALVRILRMQGRKTDELQKLVYAHVRNGKKFGYYGASGVLPVTFFGAMEEVYTQAVVIDEETDLVAKMVNYVYCSREKKVETINRKVAEELWRSRKTSLFDRDSSRAVATNMHNLCRIARKTGIGSLDEAELDVLAENEHLRWVAFHLTRGVVKLDTDEITGTNAKWKDENNMLLKHGCLVTYDELWQVTDKVNRNRTTEGETDMEDFQETDRRIVRHFPLFIEELKRIKDEKQ